MEPGVLKRVDLCGWKYSDPTPFGRQQLLQPPLASLTLPALPPPRPLCAKHLRLERLSPQRCGRSKRLGQAEAQPLYLRRPTLGDERFAPARRKKVRLVGDASSY